MLALVHDSLAGEWGVAPDAEESRRFGASVGEWPEFADTVASLDYLRQHYKLAVLSNVDRLSFGATITRLGVTFDAVYTAEDIGSYKPDPRNFGYLIEHLAIIARVDPSATTSIPIAPEPQPTNPWDEEKFNTPIETLDLSVRVFNSLKRTGITTIGEVLEMLDRGTDAMLAIRNFGEKSLDELALKRKNDKRVQRTNEAAKLFEAANQGQAALG